MDPDAKYTTNGTRLVLRRKIVLSGYMQMVSVLHPRFLDYMFVNHWYFYLPSCIPERVPCCHPLDSGQISLQRATLSYWRYGAGLIKSGTQTPFFVTHH